MSEAEKLLTEISANPEDDAPRLAYARHIRGLDSDRAEFIELQIEAAKVRRAKRGFLPDHPHPLQRKNEQAWTRTIAKYARAWTFDRGFIAKIEIDPHLFLEYGEWLFVNAPIRSVAFVRPEDGVFPMRELTDSPLLRRLDAITVLDRNLENAALLTLADSTNLTRLQYLSMSQDQVELPTYERFAAAPGTRKCLMLGAGRNGFPGETMGDTGRDDYWGAAIHDWLPMPAEGHALEKKYGYVPWLHAKDNWTNDLDAGYFVAQGILPVKPPGSPVT